MLNSGLVYVCWICWNRKKNDRKITIITEYLNFKVIDCSGHIHRHVRVCAHLFEEKIDDKRRDVYFFITEMGPLFQLSHDVCRFIILFCLFFWSFLKLCFTKEKKKEAANLKNQQYFLKYIFNTHFNLFINGSSLY